MALIGVGNDDDDDDDDSVDGVACSDCALFQSFQQSVS